MTSTNATLRALLYAVSCVLGSAGCGDDAMDGSGAGAGGASGAAGTSGSGGTGGAGGTSGTGGSGGGSPPEYSYTACTDETRVGEFPVISYEPIPVAPTPKSDVSGFVKNGVVPADVADVIMQVGDCALLQGRDLACAPKCEVGTTCDADGSCIPEPRNQDVGTVTITGLKDPIEMSPRASRNNYESGGTLQYPAFDEGATVVLTAAGGTLTPFELVAEGVALLDIATESVALTDGMPMTVSWAPPAQTGRSHVKATLNLALHGGDPVRIECDAPDTGTLEIPAALISALLDYTYGGFPRLVIQRQTADAVELDVGCVELSVVVEDTLDVEVPGLTSCNDEMPCPMGQSCGVDLRCY